MLRTLAVGVALSAALAMRAQAQTVSSPDSIRSTTLAPVTVVASKPERSTVISRAWHMNEDRAQVLAMMNENRRLEAQLHGYDKQISRLEQKLVVVKARYDAKQAEIAATDSLTADTHRRRLELEARLQALQGNSVAVAPAEPKFVFPAEK